VPEKKEPKSASEMLDALFDFIEGSDEDIQQLPLEKVERELSKAGIDPAPTVGSVFEMLAAARAERELLRARQERQRLLKLQRGLERKPLSGGEVRIRYERAVAHSGAAAAFRKFEGASPQDQESALEDLDLLDKMADEDESDPRG
jgi:hypothetical protein